MKRLLLFLLFASPAFAAHDYTLYPPNVPAAKLEAVPEPQTNTFCAANLACTVTGAWTFSTPPVLGTLSSLAVSGTTTLTGSLVPKIIDNVQVVDSTLSRGGSDIGAELNLAYAALPASGGVIWLFPKADGTNYTYSTPIVFATSAKPVRLECYGATAPVPTANGACTLNYTPTTATNAIKLDYTLNASGSGIEPNHGIINVTFINNGCFTNGGCGSSASGIKIGNTNGGAGQARFRVRIIGFGTGFDAVGIPNYAWGMHFEGSSFIENTLAMNMGAGTENVVCEHCMFVSNGQEFTATGGDTYFYGTSFDGHTNTTGGINLNWNGRASTAFAEFTDCHFEANLSTNDKNYIYGGGNFKIKGGVLAIDATTGNVGNYFAAGGAYISILGLTVAGAGQTATQMIDTTGGAVRGHVEMVFTGTFTTVPTICGGGNCSGITNTSYVADLSNTTTPSTYAYPFNFLEQAAPAAGTAGSEECYGDSTSHTLKCSYNNSAYSNVALNPPLVAGTTDLGTTALPFGNLWLGTAATNNFKFQPASTTGARIITIADPLSPTTVALPMTIASGTKALNTASITTATCDAGTAAAATGVLSTDTVDWSFNAAPTATNKYGAFLVVYAVPSSNTITFFTCNPSATTSTPTAMTVNWSVRRP
jgi:hypothetical protein